MNILFYPEGWSTTATIFLEFKWLLARDAGINMIEEWKLDPEHPLTSLLESDEEKGCIEAEDIQRLWPAVNELVLRWPMSAQRLFHKITDSLFQAYKNEIYWQWDSI